MAINAVLCLQEVDILKSVSYDRNVVQFYGTCLWGDKTMLVLEFMEVSSSYVYLTCLYRNTFLHVCCCTGALHVIHCHASVTRV